MAGTNRERAPSLHHLPLLFESKKPKEPSELESDKKSERQPDEDSPVVRGTYRLNKEGWANLGYKIGQRKSIRHKGQP